MLPPALPALSSASEEVQALSPARASPSVLSRITNNQREVAVAVAAAKRPACEVWHCKGQRCDQSDTAHRLRLRVERRALSLHVWTLKLCWTDLRLLKALRLREARRWCVHHSRLRYATHSAFSRIPFVIYGVRMHLTSQTHGPGLHQLLLRAARMVAAGASATASIGLAATPAYYWTLWAIWIHLTTSNR